MARRPLALALALTLGALTLPGGAQAASAPDAGTAFEPTPVSAALYGFTAPSAAPALQKHVVEAADGTDLFVETWLPAPKDGNTPPARIPTVLVMTPYVQEDGERYTTRNLANLVQWFTARGYAVAQHHVRGTGNSGGCLEQTSDDQIDDAARVIEYLGEDAPWTNGAVGMYGHSYDAETQISVAGRGDPAKIASLKAIIPSATVGGQYEYSFMDGVPYLGQAALSNGSYLATTSLAPGEAPIDAHTLERFGCQPELVLGSTDYSGDLTSFWRSREYRPEIGQIEAATLWVHGLADWNVMPITTTGSFDNLPATTPHKAIFGQWEHNYPDRHAGVQPDWARQDWLDVATAWFDRYLKNAASGVESWPAVQLQGTDGRWRGEPGFPRTGGPAGQLALGPDGVLGATTPTGETVFSEGPDDEETVPGTNAVFETTAATAPLQLTGQPIVDLWLESSADDAHVTAKLQVIDAQGDPIEHAGSSGEQLGTFGARSLRHLAPMPDGYFVQPAGEAVATGTPVRVPLRLQPVDLVVPTGATLRLTIGGATAWARQTVPSGAAADITLLHDCQHVSALRFLMPRADAPLLNVRETDEATAGPLPSTPTSAGLSDGGGRASAAVCGQAPERPFLAGEAFPLTPEPSAPGATPPAAGSAAPAATGGGRPTTSGCRDTVAPTSEPGAPRVRSRRLRLAGSAADSGCGSTAPARVAVSVARKTASGCRFLASTGRLGAVRPCTRTGGSYLAAKGTAAWTFTAPGALPAGRYQVWTRATDAAGNVERKQAARNLRRLTVRR